MWNAYRIITRRIVRAAIGLTSLGCLSVVVAGVSAQDASTDTASVAVILADFEKAWDDEAWGPSQGRAGKYMRLNDDLGWKARVTAIQMIVQNGSQSTPDLVKALSSESTPVRALAAQALGYCGNADAKPALAGVVEHDADAIVRLYAADSLGMLGGRDDDELFRRLDSSEKNRDAKRHIRYALDREGQALDVDVPRRLGQWNLEGLGAAALNEPAPDFELTSLDGRQVRLSQFQGKKAVVLVFVYGDT